MKNENDISEHYLFSKHEINDLLNCCQIALIGFLWFILNSDIVSAGQIVQFCIGDYSGIDTDSGKAGIQMQSMADSAKYKESARKIGYMITRYEDDGFTSYWL